MTIEDADKIDLLGRNRATGSPTLVISDHLPWDVYGEHFGLIERKLGTYLRFIKSGQIWENFGGDTGVPIAIELVYKYPPTPLAEKFLSAAREQLRAEEGIEFVYEALKPKD